MAIILGHMSKTRALVLSGGAGTRLWPLSRESYPKQFHDLTQNGQTLLGQTVNRLSPFFDDIRVLTTQNLSGSTLGLIKRHNLKAGVLAEPFGRNTAAAAYLACWQAKQENFNGVLALFSADHVVLNPAQFAMTVAKSIEVAQNNSVVVWGIKTHFPSTAYGYIETDSEKAGESLKQNKAQAFGVKSFIEKPNAEKAAQLIQKSHIFWNAGIFFFKGDFLMQMFDKHFPEIPMAFKQLKSDLSNLSEVYNNCPNQSLDKAVMEKLGQELQCIPCDIGWTDVGSWEEVAPFFTKNSQKEIVEIESQSNVFLNFSGEPKVAAVVGAKDLIVVETKDALLVLKKGFGQQLKAVLDKVKSMAPTLLKDHPFETRPWGQFEVLRDEGHYKSKKITVLPGQKLSYQSHTKRAENWIIVKGIAEVTLNDKVHTLKRGESIFIPQGAKHRMANPSQVEILEFIEVQTGEYFGEDDITRYSDDYGRA
jgi:mannose-1-phosphate guanylyltransferase/mannose-6-phosphate isomerase